MSKTDFYAAAQIAATPKCPEGVDPTSLPGRMGLALTRKGKIVRVWWADGLPAPGDISTLIDQIESA